MTLRNFRWATQWQATYRPLGLTELFTRDTKWPGESHQGGAVAVSLRLGHCMWLGHWRIAILPQRSQGPQQ